MKFLMFIRAAESYRATPPPPAMMAAMEKFVGESMAKGVLRETGGLKPTSEGILIRSTGGKLKTTDGPFTEAKEVIGGFAIVETRTREEALAIAHEFMELHRTHWPEFECESEVRPLEEY
jgi:hypothetical protein